ncbi:MAG TPA: hypothetical protein VL147_03340 [Devosia sp.]|nr:hypothetical protein [Devosia sp.]
MRRAAVISHRRISISRGWTILGLALASWALLIAMGQGVFQLFAFVSAAF